MARNPKRLTIALDVMGGDNAPSAVIEGADIVLKKDANLSFLLFGDQAQIESYLEKYPLVRERSLIVHTDEVVSAEEKPSKAIRSGKKTSMGLAIKSVKDKKADAVVSSGNTGALMALSKLTLRTLDGIYRPAITGIVPTIKGKSVMLDMGANAECDAKNLLQFALMGEAFARVVLEKENPTIGLLNIGSEELKGHDMIKEAQQLIQSKYKHLNYYGYIEGDDILKGTTDVVVTDGFTGNVSLKSIEGTAKMCKHYIKRGFASSLWAKIGLLFAGCSLKKVFGMLDPSNYNGAIFLGLNGISVKSHGNADAKGFANAIKIAVTLCREQINQKIIEEIRNAKSSE